LKQIVFKLKSVPESMIQEILVPESILEEIALDGRNEAEKGGKAIGVLFGYHNALDDKVTVTERHSLPREINMITDEKDIINQLLKIGYSLRYIRAIRSFLKHKKRIKDTDYTPAILDYHTLQYGAWSPKDMKHAARYSKFCRRDNLEYARFLYSVKDGIPLAIDGYGNNITVSTIKPNEKCL